MAAGAFSPDTIVEALLSGVLAGALSSGCFTAGTPVLLGNGKTEEAINGIHVGQRVATDGGDANSADGKAAADPNATEVNQKTWRELTITAGDWQIQTLEPLSWIKQRQLADGSSIDLNDVTGLAEMGVTGDIVGTIDSITACPQIASGPGRVVLTTVSHLNDDVYHLTLSGNVNETIGVSGVHRIYTEDRGWVHADQLTDGELVRTTSGDAHVTSIVRDPGLYRVYNMCVESDHDYYVGNDDILVHNMCQSSSSEQELANADRLTIKSAEEALGGINGNSLDAPGRHVVYGIINKDNGELLHIGESGNFDRRFYDHQRAFAKLGMSNIGHVILDETEGKAAARHIETDMIKFFRDKLGYSLPYNFSNH